MSSSSNYNEVQKIGSVVLPKFAGLGTKNQPWSEVLSTLVQSETKRNITTSDGKSIEIILQTVSSNEQQDSNDVYSFLEKLFKSFASLKEILDIAPNAYSKWAVNLNRQLRDLVQERTLYPLIFLLNGIPDLDSDRSKYTVIKSKFGIPLNSKKNGFFSKLDRLREMISRNPQVDGIVQELCNSLQTFSEAVVSMIKVAIDDAEEEEKEEEAEVIVQQREDEILEEKTMSAPIVRDSLTRISNSLTKISELSKKMTTPSEIRQSLPKIDEREIGQAVELSAVGVEEIISLTPNIPVPQPIIVTTTTTTGTTPIVTSEKQLENAMMMEEGDGKEVTTGGSTDTTTTTTTATQSSGKIPRISERDPYKSSDSGNTRKRGQNYMYYGFGNDALLALRKELTLSIIDYCNLHNATTNSQDQHLYLSGVDIRSPPDVSTLFIPAFKKYPAMKKNYGYILTFYQILHLYENVFATIEQGGDYTKFIPMIESFMMNEGIQNAIAAAPVTAFKQVLKYKKSNGESSTIRLFNPEKFQDVIYTLMTGKMIDDSFHNKKVQKSGVSVGKSTKSVSDLFDVNIDKERIAWKYLTAAKRESENDDSEESNSEGSTKSEGKKGAFAKNGVVRRSMEWVLFATLVYCSMCHRSVLMQDIVDENNSKEKKKALRMIEGNLKRTATQYKLNTCILAGASIVMDDYVQWLTKYESKRDKKKKKKKNETKPKESSATKTTTTTEKKKKNEPSNKKKKSETGSQPTGDTGEEDRIVEDDPEEESRPRILPMNPPTPSQLQIDDWTPDDITRKLSKKLSDTFNLNVSDVTDLIEKIKQALDNRNMPYNADVIERLTLRTPVIQNAIRDVDPEYRREILLDSILDLYI